MRRILRALIAGALSLNLTASTGCISKSSSQGVKNLWRGDSPPVFRQGTSTQADVLAALGPPSQLIALGDQTVFYYLLEQRRSNSLVLVLYNQTETNVVYDRAIFFFDTQGRLKEFATSDERIPPTGK